MTPDTTARRLVQGIGLVAVVTMAASGLLLVLSSAGVTSLGTSRSTTAETDGAQVVAAATAAAVRAGGPASSSAASVTTSGPQASTTAAPSATVAPTTTAVPTGPGSVTIMFLSAPGEAQAARPVYVYRPAVPDSTTLPVVYFLHGVPGGPDDLFRAGFADYLNNAFQNGVAPFVVVAPDGNGTSHDDTEWADAVDGSDKIESFLIDVVIPAVEGADGRDGAHRAIFGDSMGGYGAMNIAMRHPGVFSQVVSLAGYFHVDDPAGMFEGQQVAIDANSPDHHPEAATGLRILLLDGTGESDPVIIGESARMSALLRAAGVDNDFELAPGDDSYAFASSQFDRITSFLEAGF